MNARDIAIRTILGEAANESPMGQAAVAHVLRNRAADPRWPSAIQDVALQPKQFSAWNSGAGGNDLVNKYGPGSDPYEKVGLIYDQVMSGQIADPTGGATHYYSPAGMQALVDQGAQGNLLPNWLQQTTAERGGNNTTIGGHIFSGLANGQPMPTQSPQGETGGLAGALGLDMPDWLTGAFEDQGAAGLPAMTASAPSAPVIQPNMAEPYRAPERDASAAYRAFFERV